MKKISLFPSPQLLIVLFISFFLQNTIHAETLEIRVDHGNDDAEEFSNGSMYRNSSDLELTKDSSTQKIGIRFNTLTIPKNSTITKAYIEFHVDEKDNRSTYLVIQGEAHDDPPNFSSSNNNISQRNRTTQSKNWNPKNWNHVGHKKKTPELKNIVQEVIDRGGWNTGNAIVFIITGTGKRVAESYEGSSNKAPLLHIEYTPPTPETETEPNTITLSGTLRDFHETHPDFQLYDDIGHWGFAGLTTHIVQNTLGNDKKPIFNGQRRSISTADNFNQWFNTIANINQAMPYSITLEKQDGVYTYDSALHPVGNNNSPSGFFPLDNQLFGNEGNGHNYHMTYEIHSQFTYQGGEVFEFSGDDDVWVFINNQLAVDIGGVHSAITDEVTLDSLGLTIGETYNFDMFWAERHTIASNFKITTSIKLEDVTPPDEDSQCTAVFEDDFESGLSDKWRTLKALGGFTPQIATVNGNGRLRFTNRDHDLSTAVTLDYVFPSQNNKFIMEFDYYAYGGCANGSNYKGSSGAGDWGADGIALTLFDSSVGRSPRVGAAGGSLGYANRGGESNGEPGFEKGWFGLGIDEYGNFKINDEGRKDIYGYTGSIHDNLGEQPNTIALRGSEASGYRLLASTTTLNEVLAAQLNNTASYKSGRYRFTVDMSAAGQQEITLERNTGSGYTTLIGPLNGLDGTYHQDNTPEKFRFAFSSGTGGGCNIHEIDNLKICGEGEEYIGGTPICWATTDDNTQIYKIDPRVGANPLPQSIVIEADRVLRAEGGSYRPSDGYLYKFDDDGETYNSHENDDGPDSLYKINTTTGHVTLVAAALVPDHVDAAEFYINPETQEEIFYAIEKGRKLYAFNPITWQALAGYPKTMSVSSIGGLAINSHTGDAYVIDDYNWNNKKPKLYKLNLQTAQATFLFTLQDEIDAEGLAFADDGNLYVENDSGVGSSNTRNKIHKINLSNGSLEAASYLTGLNGDIETLSCNGGASIAPPIDPPETDDPLFDYGDAPESYNTAFHIIPPSPTVYLGTTPPDNEIIEGVSPYPYSIGATGDDIGAVDDEDGVTFDNLDIQGQTFVRKQIYIFTVKTNGSGYLNAWIDWNANGLFENSEKISTNEETSSGSILLSVIIPESATLATTYARFRYSSTQNLLPAGPANDGEVEDYSIVIADSIPVCSIDEVPSAVYSTAAVAVNLNRLTESTRIFQTQFNNEKWEGYLLSYDLNTTNNEGSTRAQQWNAANKLGAFNTRKIMSYNPKASNEKGINFLWDELNNEQKQHLKKNVNNNTAKKRLNWIRGEQANEDNTNGPFRERSNLLGDIIHSSPIFSGQRENFGYTSLTEAQGGSKYPAFMTKKQSRQAAIFVGANDGMLHAFNANTGEELFGFIPNEVIPNLADLSSLKYGCQDEEGEEESCLPHQYYVDGTSVVGDAYFNAEWHTILIGSLGKGGKGIFTLDVTNPDPKTDPNVSLEKFDTDKIMWELSATQATYNDSVYAQHMGYSTTKPSLVRLNNNQWAAVISNGYQSESGTAMLFLIDISNGELIKAIDTGVGSSSTPNGLSSPIVVDTNNDRTADAVYAGDLQGNMWKFDLSSTNSENWAVAYSDGNTPKPLFTTCEDANETLCTKHQAITAKPEVGHHPAGGYMVYFGTGQYFDVSDNVMATSPDIHALYGIRDNGSAITSLTNLVEQVILQESIVPNTGNDLRARITSNHPVDFTTATGWYMRLIAPNNTKQGERIIARALLRDDRLIITTLIPPQNSCTWGGSSWITEINAIDGTPLDFPPIDINDDLQFTDADKVDYQGNAHVISAIKKISLGMILSTPEIITHTVLSEGKYLNGTIGTIGMFRESTSRAIGRQSWRRLR